VSEFRTTEFFTAPADRAVIEQCDRLMEALVDLEDDYVHSSAVSADIGQGLVLVEVYISADDMDEASAAAHNRVQQALRVVGIDAGTGPGPSTYGQTVERRVELVPA